MKKAIPITLLILLIAFCSRSQNVGIGTTTPTRAKLEVNGAVDYTSAIFGGESTGIGIMRNNPAIGFNDYYSGGHRYIANGYSGQIWLDAINGDMFFDMFGYGNKNTLATVGVNCMVINNKGNIGIRASPANSSLFVKKGTNIDGSAVFGGSTYNSFFNYSSVEDTYIRGGINGSNVYINDIPGGIVSIGGGTTKVGINTYGFAPAYSLEVHQVKETSGAETGILLVNSLFNQWEIFNNLPLTFKYNGQAKAHIDWDDGHYAQLSDGRLKTNIQTLPGLMDKLVKLRPVAYEMKNNKKHERKIGFIAQEVKLLFPGLVSVSTDTSHGFKEFTDLHMMDYSGFGVLAIKGIQEQQQQIEELKNANTAQVKIIDALLKRIEKLESFSTSKNLLK